MKKLKIYGQNLDSLLENISETVCLDLINLHYKKREYKNMRMALRYHSMEALTRIIKDELKEIEKILWNKHIQDKRDRRSYMIFDNIHQALALFGETLVLDMFNQALSDRVTKSDGWWKLRPGARKELEARKFKKESGGGLTAWEKCFVLKKDNNVEVADGQTETYDRGTE